MYEIDCCYRRTQKFETCFFSSEQNLLVRSCDQLGHFLQHRETNLRYLALESLCRLAGSEFSLDTIKKHRGTVIRALKVIRKTYRSPISIGLNIF